MNLFLNVNGEITISAKSLARFLKIDERFIELAIDMVLEEDEEMGSNFIDTVTVDISEELNNFEFIDKRLTLAGVLLVKSVLEENKIEFGDWEVETIKKHFNLALNKGYS